MMHGHEKSDPVVVAENRANTDGRPSVESGEPRACPWLEQGTGAKGNTSQTDTRRTPSRASMSPGLERVRTAARPNKEERFTALLHHVDVDLLRQAYLWLKREAAPGVDGVTWKEYGPGLEEKLRDLHGRVHRGSYRALPPAFAGAGLRRRYIPKPDGRQRPLGIAALEDKIVQRAVVEVLNAIYEEDFLGLSYGFRPGRSQHDAPRVKPVGRRLTDALALGITRTQVNGTLDADIRSFLEDTA